MTTLLPITVSADAESRPNPADAATDAQTSSGGAIHIKLPGRAIMSVENGADPALLRCVLESISR